MPHHRETMPIAANEMERAFEDHLHDAGTDLHSMDAPRIWRAFVAFAARPITPASAAPNANEDLLQFEVYSGGEDLPYVCLARVVSLADENHDHIKSVGFACSLEYEPATDIAALEDGTMSASFEPDRPAAETAAFIQRVEQSEAYRTLIEQHQPIRIGMTAPA